jgi:hypothetical protein
MTNVVKAHTRYTDQSAKALIEGQVPKYDKDDRTNNKAAWTFLLAFQIDLSNTSVLKPQQSTIKITVVNLLSSTNKS